MGRAMIPRVPLRRHSILQVSLALAISLVAALAVVGTAGTVRAAQGDWPTYLHDASHSGFNSDETIIASSSAGQLKKTWQQAVGGSISAQPITANDMIYIGSWDGYERSYTTAHALAWQTFLGETPNCGGGAAARTPFGPITAAQTASIGVASTPTVVDVNGTSTLFVGGGDHQVYALNAQTGAILWHTSLGSSSAYFLWGSPAYWDGHIYIGVASVGDCPLVRGKLVQLNAATGAVEHTFFVVPSGCTGGPVWGTPTVDPGHGLIFFVTGNHGSCGQSETLTEAIIKLNLADLSWQAAWQVPPSQHTPDGDFGATPTLFSATINGKGRSLVGVANKNGLYYAFDRLNIHVGPVWTKRVAVAGDCPQCGAGSISPSAYDGSRLYVAGGNTTINGAACKGSLRALSPATGAFNWQHCMQSGPVLSAVPKVPGVAVIGESTWIIVVATSNGQTLFRFQDKNGSFHGAAAISNGVLYQGNRDGTLYAFAP
jgi:polyvinyl alcohol dehydrogenase (cytochrome)